MCKTHTHTLYIYIYIYICIYIYYTYKVKRFKGLESAVASAEALQSEQLAHCRQYVCLTCTEREPNMYLMQSEQLAHCSPYEERVRVCACVCVCVYV